MRELNDKELDTVSGGLGVFNFQRQVIVSSQRNTQVAVSSGILSINPATNLAIQTNVNNQFQI